ncbi:hypothetical protein [Tsuneonella suprasediminis]|uniref:hypothetical protein n=1 Tax=Tsuneonella suprasediminis TaxID=2306996 RepID=UPI002F94AB67
MKKLALIAAGIVPFAMLAGCGSSGGCSGVSVEPKYGLFSGVKVTNTTDEQKLVELVILRADGSEVATQTIPVPAKDIVEQGISSLSEDFKVEAKSCT